MQAFNGKRTDRLQLPTQLRTDPDLGAAIRFLAQINRRNIQLQILHWILEGVEKEKSKLSQAASGSQATSGEIPPAPPMSVRGGSRQVPSRRKEDAA
jgi:hypothetical protein